MTQVLGVDPSMTATATCVAFDGLEPAVATSKTHPKSGTDWDKLRRMRRQRDLILVSAGAADLVVLEGLSHNSKGSATRDLAGLWWLVFDALVAERHTVAVCAPQTRAKWATGKGNAHKFVVGQAIAKRWPGVPLADDNQADALVLASMGLHHFASLPWEPTKFQTESVRSLTFADGADS